MNIYEEPVFTIGQFAAMHGINKKTLMWYDEIGLLKPAFVRANGYRCYTYKQSGMLETILMLRALHMPLSDIADFMADRSAPALASLLTDKLAEVDEMIRYLEELRTVMEKRRAEMRQLCVIDVDAIAVVEEPADQYHLTVETSPDLTLAQGAARVTAAIQAHQLTACRDIRYGALLPLAAIKAGRYDDYTALLITLPPARRDDADRVQPAGRYLRAYCQGPWEGLAARYQAMCTYAAEHGLALAGDAYESGINDAIAGSMAETITQIEIAVVER